MIERAEDRAEHVLRSIPLHREFRKALRDAAKTISADYREIDDDRT